MVSLSCSSVLVLLHNVMLIMMNKPSEAVQTPSGGEPNNNHSNIAAFFTVTMSELSHRILKPSDDLEGEECLDKTQNDFYYINIPLMLKDI